MPSSALTPDQRRRVMAALQKGSASQAALARRFNVSGSTISRLAAREVAQQPPVIDTRTELALRSFLKRLGGKYAVSKAILFGSRARRDHSADSDADLAVVLKGKRGNRWDIGSDMARTAFDVMLETGILVQPLPLWESELKRPALFSNPALVENIKRDGLRL